MTCEQAQEILLLHRPSRGAEMGTEAEMAEALRMVASDPELARWLEQHREFQAQVEKQIASIEPPADLKSRILAGARISEKKESLLRRHQVWVIAAAIVVLFALSDWLLSRNRDDRSFANFRSRMTEFALRSYQMDIVTNSGPVVRQFLASEGAPSDFLLTPGLERLPVKGGGRLSWQNRPVAMMCFSLTNNQTAFMFVMDREAVVKEPSGIEVAAGKDLSSVAWVKNGKVYLLAAAERPEALQSLAAP
jgi:hypothetical protein